MEHAAKVGKGQSDTEYPDWADTGARRALVQFFSPEHRTDFEDPALVLAIAVDEAVLTTKPDSWVGDRLKEKKVKLAIKAMLPEDFDRLDELFELVKEHREYS